MVRRLILFVFLLFPALAFAQLEEAHYNTSKPIEITADSLEVLQKDQVARFSGNVMANQGDIKMSATVMTVHYRSGAQKSATQQSVSRIEVEGKVLLATPAESAQGDKGVYDVDGKKITLVGHVVLTRGENVVKGDALEYNLNTGRSRIVGSPHVSAAAKDGKPAPKGRVRGLFVPEKKPESKTEKKNVSQ